MGACLAESFFFVGSELQQHYWKKIQNFEWHFKLSLVELVFCAVLETDSWKCIMKPPIIFSLPY